MTGIESYLWGRACLPTSPSTTGIQRMAAILGLAASSFHRLLSSLSLSLSLQRPLFSTCANRQATSGVSSFPLFALNALSLSPSASLTMQTFLSTIHRRDIHRREREFPFSLPREDTRYA